MLCIKLGMLTAGRTGQVDLLSLSTGNDLAFEPFHNVCVWEGHCNCKRSIKEQIQLPNANERYGSFSLAMCTLPCECEVRSSLSRPRQTWIKKCGLSAMQASTLYEIARLREQRQYAVKQQQTLQTATLSTLWWHTWGQHGLRHYNQTPQSKHLTSTEKNESN